MTGCIFLTNYALVLDFLSRHPSVTAYEISSRIGITERAVRRIIADLNDEGYISKEKTGRRVRYEINSHMPLRFRTLQDVSVGDLLVALG
jgi:predicted transcriptional regulator